MAFTSSYTDRLIQQSEYYYGTPEMTPGLSGSFSGSFQGDGSGLTNLPSTSPFPFTGDAIISGSLEITGSGGLKLTGPLEVSMTASSGVIPLSIKTISDSSSDVLIKVRDDGGSFDLITFDSEGRFNMRGTSTDSEGAGYYVSQGGVVKEHAKMGFVNGKAQLSLSTNSADRFKVFLNSSNTSPMVGLEGRGTIALGTSISAATLPNEPRTNTMFIKTGTAPSTAETDNIQFFAQDVNGVAGTASPTFLTEDSQVLQLGVTSSLSYISASAFKGDGSQLINLPISDPFPHTASSAAIISRSIASGDTDSTALRLFGSGSISESGIFEVEGSAGPLFSVADGLDGVLMEVNNISGLPLFQVSSSNEVFINRGNLTSGVTTATASFAHFTGSFQGDGSQLTNLNTTTPTLAEVVTAGASATGDVSITGSLIISGSFNAFRLNTTDVILGEGAGALSTINGPRNVFVGYQAGYSNTIGDDNVAVGYQAGYALHNNASDANVFIGKLAGAGGTSGAAIMSDANNNIGVGQQTLLYLTTGDDNIAIGSTAMRGTGAAMSATKNIAIGVAALYKTDSGDNNIGIGNNAGLNQTTGDGNITIGSGSYGIAGESNQLRIGHQGVIAISGSLATGDVIFYNTASAPNFSGSFQGDGSGLTNLPSTSPFPFTGDAQITGSLKITGLFKTDSHITASGNISASGKFIGTTGSFGRAELGKSGALNGSIKFNTLHGPSYELKSHNNSLTLSGTTGATVQGFALDSQIENFTFLDGGSIHVQRGITTGSKKGGGLHIEAQGFNQSNGKKGIFSTDTTGPYIGNSSYGSTGTYGIFRIINGLSLDNDANSGSFTSAEFGDYIKFNLPITASGNISASGDVITKKVGIIDGAGLGLGFEGGGNEDSDVQIFTDAAGEISFYKNSVQTLVINSANQVRIRNSYDLVADQNISASGNITSAGLTLPTFTTNRVPFIGSNGILTTDSGFEYNSTTNQLSVDSLNVIHLTSSFITSSRIHTSGSNIFGDDTTDTQTLIGTTLMTGSAQISGSLTFGGTAPTDLYTGGPKKAIDTSAVGGIKAKGAILLQASADSSYNSRILFGTSNSYMAFGRRGDNSTAIRGVTQNYAWQLFGITHGLIGSTYTTNLPDTTFADNLTISGSGTYMSEPLKVHGSGSSVFEVIGTEGTLFSVDDDLDGTIFSANDRTGLPVLEASASGEVYIGKSPQSLYTTAVISSTTANISQSIFGLSTSSYDGVFVDYTATSASNARAGSIMSIWNGSNLNFTETTTTDIGDTTNLIIQVAISQSQAQIQSYATTAGYKIKTIIRSI